MSRCCVPYCKKRAVDPSLDLCQTHADEYMEIWDAYWDGKEITWSLNARGYVIGRVNGKLVYQHRFFAALYLARPLHPYEEVHHDNTNKADNSKENLIVCVDSYEHAQLEKITRQRIEIQKWLAAL